jgi:hypothetical protein
MHNHTQTPQHIKNILLTLQKIHQHYKQFTLDKSNLSKRGGGSLLYVREKLKPICKRLQATDDYEIMQVDIHPGLRVTIKIILVYRKPSISATENDELLDHLNGIVSTTNECVK